MTVLGIDPGYERLGWGILRKEPGKFTFVSCGVIRTKKDLTHPQRLQQIYQELSQVIETNQPDMAVIEKLFFSNNAKSALNVAESRGVILCVCQEKGLKIIELTPPEIKLAAAGSGKADKKAVEKMVRLQLPRLPEGLLDDTLDALAAALSAPEK